MEPTPDSKRPLPEAANAADAALPPPPPGVPRGLWWEGGLPPPPPDGLPLGDLADAAKALLPFGVRGACATGRWMADGVLLLLPTAPSMVSGAVMGLATGRALGAE